MGGGAVYKRNTPAFSSAFSPPSIDEEKDSDTVNRIPIQYPTSPSKHIFTWTCGCLYAYLVNRQYRLLGKGFKN